MTADIVLVTMPFAPPQRPSIALSTLKAVLARADIVTRVLYPNLWFADGVGLELHQLLTNVNCEEGLIEWLFAPLAFPEQQRDDAGFIERLLQRNPTFRMRNIIRLAGVLGAARSVASRVLERTVQAILSENPSIVGCTSMFQQHVASLALLRQIKQRAPHVVTMMGGPNCETRMGRATHRNYEWIDYVVSGEAEELIVPLTQGILRDGTSLAPGNIPYGVFGPAHRLEGYPVGVGGDGVPRASVTDFAHVPPPDYSDFFSALEDISWRDRMILSLPIETARGCWWGAKSHCTFCGLNGTSMTFRSKQPERVLQEINDLYSRHGIEGMGAVDNIVDMHYFETVFPALAQSALPVRLFYETKSNLKRRHLQIARAANVVVLQPGIESLHSSLLKHMGKGVQAWQNIQFLRFAAEQGIRTIWLNLVGFPNEEDSWHQEAALLFPLLTHLEPGGVTRVRYDRYSPLFKTAGERGIKLRPFEAYQHIYPVHGADLFEQSYFFEEAFDDCDATRWIAERRPWPAGARALFEAAARWRQEWQRNAPRLAMIDDGTTLLIEDSRSLASTATRQLTGAERSVLLAADEAPPDRRLITEVAACEGLAAASVMQLVEELIAAKLLLRIDGRLLALPTNGRPRSQEPGHRHPMGTILPKGKTLDAQPACAN